MSHDGNHIERLRSAFRRVCSGRLTVPDIVAWAASRHFSVRPEDVEGAVGPFLRLGDSALDEDAFVRWATSSTSGIAGAIATAFATSVLLDTADTAPPPPPEDGPPISVKATVGSPTADSDDDPRLTLTLLPSSPADLAATAAEVGRMVGRDADGDPGRALFVSHLDAQDTAIMQVRFVPSPDAPLDKFGEAAEEVNATLEEFSAQRDFPVCLRAVQHNGTIVIVVLWKSIAEDARATRSDSASDAAASEELPDDSTEDPSDEEKKASGLVWAQRFLREPACAAMRLRGLTVDMPAASLFESAALELRFSAHSVRRALTLAGGTDAPMLSLFDGARAAFELEPTPRAAAWLALLTHAKASDTKAHILPWKMLKNPLTSVRRLHAEWHLRGFGDLVAMLREEILDLPRRMVEVASDHLEARGRPRVAPAPLTPQLRFELAALAHLTYGRSARAVASLASWVYLSWARKAGTEASTAPTSFRTVVVAIEAPHAGVAPPPTAPTAAVLRSDPSLDVAVLAKAEEATPLANPHAVVVVAHGVADAPEVAALLYALPPQLRAVVRHTAAGVEPGDVRRALTPFLDDLDNYNITFAGSDVELLQATTTSGRSDGAAPSDSDDSSSEGPELLSAAFGSLVPLRTLACDLSEVTLTTPSFDLSLQLRHMPSLGLVPPDLAGLGALAPHAVDMPKSVRVPFLQSLEALRGVLTQLWGGEDIDTDEMNDALRVLSTFTSTS